MGGIKLLLYYDSVITLQNKLYINEMDDDVGFAQYQHA
jgi:hypothetical protein